MKEGIVFEIKRLNKRIFTTKQDCYSHRHLIFKRLTALTVIGCHWMNDVFETCLSVIMRVSYLSSLPIPLAPPLPCNGERVGGENLKEKLQNCCFMNKSVRDMTEGEV